MEKTFKHSSTKEGRFGNRKACPEQMRRNWSCAKNLVFRSVGNRPVVTVTSATDGTKFWFLNFRTLRVLRDLLRKLGGAWSPRFRHSRMLLAGIQGNFGLDPRLKRSGVTSWYGVA